MSQYQIHNSIPDNLKGKVVNVDELVLEFAAIFEPIENDLYVMVDARTNARFCECHISAEKFVELSTIDVPLDPEEQPEYRANRDVAEDHIAFESMKEDALYRRAFSNIVTEFYLSYDPEHPLKVIGGQHRYVAIKEAFNEGINEYHGVKVYFGLDTDQRLDVQLISNINIAVSTDLYDRLQETAVGPELRDWCQKVGFLAKGEDFSSRRQRSKPTTVRSIRSFILNFYLGKSIHPDDYDNVDTTPVLVKTGKPDKDWDEFRKSHPEIWNDPALDEAGKEFALLDDAQELAIGKMREENKKIPPAYSEKALNFAVMTAWAYVAGLLQDNPTRLQRHYGLSRSKGKDPLNAEAMAKGRHKSDPENYRGLGTRNDSKERGRCVEFFYAQAEKGSSITSAIIDIAIKRYHIKQDRLELDVAEKKVK
jgi:hypothetical protein